LFAGYTGLPESGKLSIKLKEVSWKVKLSRSWAGLAENKKYYICLWCLAMYELRSLFDLFHISYNLN